MSVPSLEDLDPEGARRARAAYAKMCPIPTDDPYGAKRLENSQAQTPAGLKRLFNQVAREWGIGALTDAEDSEQSKETLEPREIDRNAYRRAATRERCPRDMPSRRKPGWVACRFVLPAPVVEGLTFLARSKADSDHAERSELPRGQRRRYPKSKNFHVTEALNSLLADYGLSQFCVSEAEPVRGRVRRFAGPTDRALTKQR